MDYPSTRRSHVLPTPRAGGVGVAFAFYAALFVVFRIALAQTSANLHHLSPEMLTNALQVTNSQLAMGLGLVTGGFLICAVGLVDDLLDLKPITKLVAQVAIALIASTNNLRIAGFHIPWTHTWLELPFWLSIVLSVAWFIAVMNAVNFLDGLDGLVTGYAAIASFMLFAVAVTKGNLALAVIAIALAGALCGFIRYNFNPAKIFLGDSGSLFIGFILASISILGVSKGALSISLLIPLALLAVPFGDTAAAVIRRLWAGEHVFSADRQHVHHQLVYRYGLSVRQAVLLLYAVCFVLGATALLMAR